MKENSFLEETLVRNVKENKSTLLIEEIFKLALISSWDQKI